MIRRSRDYNNQFLLDLLRALILVGLEQHPEDPCTRTIGAVGTKVNSVAFSDEVPGIRRKHNEYCGAGKANCIQLAPDNVCHSPQTIKLHLFRN